MKVAETIRAAFNYYQSGDLQKAAHVCDNLLKAHPASFDALHLLGIINFELGDYDAAIHYIKKALQRSPGSVEANVNLGTALKKKGLYDEAIICYQEALRRTPGHAEAHCNLGVLLQEKLQYDNAIAHYRSAIALSPNYADAYYNLGTALKKKGLYDEAITCYQKALRLNPGHAEAHCNLGVCLQEKLQYTEAEAHYRTAIRLNPALADAYSNMGNILAEQGNMSEAESYHRYALRLNPCQPSYFSNLLFMLHNTSGYDARTVFGEHLKFAKQFEAPLLRNIQPHPNTKIADRRLKVGYVSSDFRRHSVACFFEPALTSHNQEHFEVFCYSNSFDRDEVTERLRRHADQWRDIAAMPDEKAAELIRRDGIDILVDLAGHTARNRLLVFARKPAPVQVSWIGYPATTGLSSMDYKIVDAHTDPPEMTEQFYTETLVRLPESFLCYLPEKDSPKVGPLPVLASGRITFGSCNNFAKVSPESIDLWATILKKVPGSRLIMKAKSLSERSVREYILDIFTQKAVDPELIDLLGWQSSTSGHLETYNRIDIALDPFPYNGTTTTCEALWMGVPVITLAGNTHASRVGASLLSNTGLHEFIAETPGEYENKAVHLANDAVRLRFLRKQLRDMMRHSPLYNAKGFTFGLELRYRRMWEKWCASA